jgi:hypothetical protein
MPIRCPTHRARHTVADFIHSPDNLMTGNERHLVKGEIALDDVNIGAADRADAHFHPDLTRPDRGTSISSEPAATHPRPSVVSERSRA